MLSVENLQIGYEYSLIEASFSAKFSKGEIVVVQGDNGIGKSTFFKTLSGLIKPVSGRVLQKEELKTGWVDSHRPNVAYLTIENYLNFGINPSNELVEQLLNDFKLEFELTGFIDELSDGQFRKLSICRQLLKQPDILFLDEPSVYLDVSNKELLVALLQRNKEDLLIFCSTHDIAFAKAIATRTLVVNKRGIENF